MSKLLFIIFLLPLYAFGASNGSGELDFCLLYKFDASASTQ
ncbi:hypothetical protein ACISMR_01200, partial [Campylobacter jejuni]